MATKAFLRRLEHGAWLVGAEDLANREHPYYGPVAQVSHDDSWLHITTDAYEGHAMLNIEALPKLRKALAEIARERRAQTRSLTPPA